jgi:hypothetical protein
LVFTDEFGEPLTGSRITERRLRPLLRREGLPPIRFHDLRHTAARCNESIGLCVGSAGNGGTFEMQVTGFRATGKAAQLTVTEEITVGDISFTAGMRGHASPAGFIVLNGTVTEGSFLGAQVHQRSNLVSADGSMTSWIGELRLMPKSG